MQLRRPNMVEVTQMFLHVQIPEHSYLEQVISMVSVRPIPVTDLSQGRHVEWSRALNTCGRCIVREGWGIVTNMKLLQPNSRPNTTLSRQQHQWREPSNMHHLCILGYKPFGPKMMQAMWDPSNMPPPPTCIYPY